MCVRRNVIHMPTWVPYPWRVANNLYLKKNKWFFGVLDKIPGFFFMCSEKSISLKTVGCDQSTDWPYHNCAEKNLGPLRIIRLNRHVIIAANKCGNAPKQQGHSVFITNFWLWEREKKISKVNRVGLIGKRNSARLCFCANFLQLCGSPWQEVGTVARRQEMDSNKSQRVAWRLIPSPIFF